MNEWRWADPFYLFWLIVVPIIIILIYYYGRYKFNLLNKTLGSKVVPFLLSGISWKKYYVKLVLLFFGLSAVLIALARPQFGESKENIKSLGIELMILFDVSQSMLAEDVSPSRLEFAKHEMVRLIDQIPGSKIGLVAFAGSAALISPITTDASAMKMFIESLTTETIGTQGTEFKMALEEAEASFARGGQGEDPTVKVTRVILVVSDGEDQEPGALEAAEKLTEKGVRVFGIGIGTEQGGQIPLRDSNGFLRDYKRDASGKPIVTTSKGEVLKSLAASGKGSFYTAQFGGTYLKNLIEDINKLEKTEFETQKIVNYQERYQVFLFIGILFLLIEIGILTTRKKNEEWRGRFQAGS